MPADLSLVWPDLRAERDMRAVGHVACTVAETMPLWICRIASCFFSGMREIDWYLWPQRELRSSTEALAQNIIICEALSKLNGRRTSELFFCPWIMMIILVLFKDASACMWCNYWFRQCSFSLACFHSLRWALAHAVRANILCTHSVFPDRVTS